MQEGAALCLTCWEPCCDGGAWRRLGTRGDWWLQQQQPLWQTQQLLRSLPPAVRLPRRPVMLLVLWWAAVEVWVRPERGAQASGSRVAAMEQVEDVCARPSSDRQ